jgi:hypothetical protein
MRVSLILWSSLIFYFTVRHLLFFYSAGDQTQGLHLPGKCSFTELNLQPLVHHLFSVFQYLIFPHTLPGCPSVHFVLEFSGPVHNVHLDTD